MLKRSTSNGERSRRQADQDEERESMERASECPGGKGREREGKDEGGARTVH